MDLGVVMPKELWRYSRTLLGVCRRVGVKQVGRDDDTFWLLATHSWRIRTRRILSISVDDRGIGEAFFCWDETGL